MYLSRSLSWRGRTCEMAGVIPGDAIMHERPVGRGYVHLAPSGNLPWGQSTPVTVRGHEFHYSSLENLPADTRFGWQVLRGHGIDGKHDGIVIGNLVASYAHLRGVDNWVGPFVAFVREQARLRTTTRITGRAANAGKAAHACA
jgi:cobyrinic acid a,c-diamide synthase